MPKTYDCIVAGSCVVDILCSPADLGKPIGSGVLHHIDPLEVTVGGITSNSGVTMARLGMDIGIFTYVGKDAWSPVIRDIYKREGMCVETMMDHPTGATSTTVVMIAPGGDRSFYHCVGAPKTLDAKAFLDHMDLWRNTKLMLLGYYSLLPNVENDLPAVFDAMREVGCKTALDAAGTGGTMQPLDRILPHLDVYVPSIAEAESQTGLTDPRKMIDAYRDCGAPGWLGVKLGTDGVLLSDTKGDYVQIPIATPPGEVIDTTGAGDSFYGGLVTGLLKGMSIADAGRLGVAAGACCVTARGGATGGRDYAFTAKLAGLS